MNVTLVTRITVNADQASIYKYFAKLKYHFLWNPHLLSISPMPVLKKGVKYNSVSSIIGIKLHSTNEIVVFNPPEEFAVENNSKSIRFRVNYKLRAIGRKTLVVCTTKVSTAGDAFIFTAPVMKVLARRELQADLQLLKFAVEHKLK